MPECGMRELATTARQAAYPMILLLLVMLAAACESPPPATTPAAPVPAGPMPTASSSVLPAPGTWRYAFPVRGHASYHRTHAGYPGTDIFADCGTPVVAVTDGTILEVSRVDRFDENGPRGPFNGGKFVALLGMDGVRYYGSHLSEVRDGVTAGARVRAGQEIGAIGRTGNASNVCHLHFGISPPCQGTGDWWIRRGILWPAQFLDAWRGKQHRSPAGQVAAWHRERGCPPAP